MKKRKLLLVILSILFSPALLAAEGSPMRKTGQYERWSDMDMRGAHCNGADKTLPSGSSSSLGRGSDAGTARSARAQ